MSVRGVNSCVSYPCTKSKKQQQYTPYSHINKHMLLAPLFIRLRTYIHNSKIVRREPTLKMKT